ncbi:MAG: tetratricopeptide repeat protein [Lachnospiraceae bacterium]|nr:tetratricopeptide repeat protein [Lachnospiraceae bacterium]
MNSVQIEEAIKRGIEARRNKDIETAKAEFQNAIDLGSARAYCHLGSIYEREDNKDKAFELYQKAADLGEPLGYTYMGDYYDSLSMDYECDGNDEKAQECYKETVAYYEKAHQGKEVKAIYKLAYCYKIGQGVGADKEKAFQLYEEIVQMEESVYHKYAYLELSRKYSVNNRIIDVENCLDLLYKSAVQSCAAAYEELGKLSAGKGIVALANAYYKKAAQLYREQNNEYGAAKAEEKIVPCDTEVEPFIGTSSEEFLNESDIATMPGSGKDYLLINMPSFMQMIFNDIMKKQGFTLIGAFPDLYSVEALIGTINPYIVFYNEVQSTDDCIAIKALKELCPSTRFIAVASHLELKETTVEIDEWSENKRKAVLTSLAILCGASDYIALPATAENIINKINMSLEKDIIYKGYKQLDLPYLKEALWLYGAYYYYEENYADAFEWLEKSAKKGHVPAMEMLVVMYNRGLGVEADPDKAYDWLEKIGVV